MDDEVSEAGRRLWTLAEHVHALTYFAPEARHALEGVGVRGFWRGYFAARAAPMGPVGAGVVIGTFFGFHPDFVRRAVPEVWSMADPPSVVAARQRGARGALSRLLPDAESRHAAEAAELLDDALRRCPAAGRPLFAANLELGRPADPWEALWHATTVLREHRGDGHVAALVAADLDGCEAHVLRLAIDGAPAADMKAARGFSDEEWDAAIRRLGDRGLVDADGRATGAGRDRRAEIERTTDQLASAVVTALGAEATARVDEILSPLARQISESGAMPYPNPIGLPAPG